MSLGYKYYRNSLIKVAILSLGCLVIFWEHLRGKGNPKDEPGALVLIAALMIIGNVWLFVAMRRAKRRELMESSGAAISAEPQANQSWIAKIFKSKKQSAPISPEAATRKRKSGRRFMSFWSIGGGLLFVVFGRGWLVNGIPLYWLGFVIILLGVLGLCGVNVFYGGPLDMRLDHSAAVDQSEKSGRVN